VSPQFGEFALPISFSTFPILVWGFPNENPEAPNQFPEARDEKGEARNQIPALPILFPQAPDEIPETGNQNPEARKLFLELTFFRSTLT